MVKRNPLIILALVLIAYLPIIGKKTFSPDSRIILQPLFTATPSEYLKMVTHFETVDFQPVRDLTFFLDLAIFKLTGISTLTFTNILLWALSCFLLYRLLKRLQHRQSEITIALLVGAFAIYPLFSQAVAWTMARKHLVAFTLILFATHFYLDLLENKRKWIFSYIAYVVAVLSHPIVLFWPVWAFLHSKFIAKKSNSESNKFFGIFCLTMITLLLTNYAYYTILNERLHDYFTQSKPSFSILRLLVHSGFYFRELAFPYQLAFTYIPDFSNCWPGFVVIGILGIFVWKQRKNLSVLSWLAFALFPFPVFIGLSVYDQYLVIPAAGVFIAVVLSLPEIKKAHFILLPLIIFWSAFTFIQAGKWSHDSQITLRNFENAPSCKSVIEAISAHAQNENNMPSEMIHYFEEKNCFSLMNSLPASEKPKILVAKSLALYYQEGQPHSDREEALKLMGKVHYYPLLTYSVLMAQKGDETEVKNATDFIYSRVQGPVQDSGPLVENVLVPYCRSHGLAKCLVLLEGKQTETPWL